MAGNHQDSLRAFDIPGHLDKAGRKVLEHLEPVGHPWPWAAAVADVIGGHACHGL